ncbi:MAG: hypothetical protein L6Q73_12890 [Aquabacterium sp.]|jgi:hypothetical protein|nr:hypothetical protein [Aquabacterium sp.]
MDASSNDSGAIEIADISAPLFQDTGQLTRSPMVLEEIVALRGVAGYVAPSPQHPWLGLRLADGTGLRVSPADDDLLYYMVEPLDEASQAAGLRPQFLAVWAAYGAIGRAALHALERAAAIARLGVQSQVVVLSPIDGLEIVEVTQEDNELPALRLLRELAGDDGKLATGALSLAGDLVFKQ